MFKVRINACLDSGERPLSSSVICTEVTVVLSACLLLMRMYSLYVYVFQRVLYSSQFRG